MQISAVGRGTGVVRAPPSEGEKGLDRSLVELLSGWIREAGRPWLRSRIEAIEAPTWADIGHRLAAIGQWEFDE